MNNKNKKSESKINKNQDKIKKNLKDNKKTIQKEDINKKVDNKETKNEKFNDEELITNAENVDKSKKVRECKCKIVKQKVDNSEISYTLIFDKHHWLEIQKQVNQYERENLIIPGYEKGKVTEDKLNSIITSEYILKKSSHVAASHASQVIDNESEIIRPENSDYYVTITKISPDTIEFNFAFIEKPKLKLDFLKNLKVELPSKPRVNKPDLERFFVSSLRQYGKAQPVSEPIQEGNVVKIDFDGYMNGKKFPNGSARDFDLDIGSKMFIPGFESKLIGYKKGDNVTIDIKFPPNYSLVEFQNKPVQFKVTIKEVSQIIMPEVNDNFIKSLNIPKIKNLNDYNNYCQQQLFERLNASWTQETNTKIIETVMNKANFDIHDKIVASEINATRNHLIEQGNLQKMSEKEYAQKFAGLVFHDDESYKKELNKLAIRRLKLMLILRQYIIENKISIPQEEIKKQYEIYKQTPEGQNDKLTNIHTFSRRLISDKALRRIINDIYNFNIKANNPKNQNKKNKENK